MANDKAERPVWEKPLLAALRVEPTVAKALEAAGVERSRAYDWRNANPFFAAAWKAAREAQGKRTRATPSARAERWKRPFLRALAETSNVSASAAAAKTQTPTVYQARRDDPSFAAAWRAALYEGYEHLEMEVLAYLRGTDTARKLDTVNAIRLLAAHRQTIAEIRAIKDDEDEQAVLDSIDALIDRMRGAKTSSADAEPANG